MVNKENCPPPARRHILQQRFCIVVFSAIIPDLSDTLFIVFTDPQAIGIELKTLIYDVSER